MVFCIASITFHISICKGMFSNNRADLNDWKSNRNTPLISCKFAANFYMHEAHSEFLHNSPY